MSSDGDAAIPRIISIHSGLTSIPALIRSFPIPQAPSASTITAPLCEATRCPYPVNSPEIHRLVGSVKNQATTYAARGLTPTPDAADLSALSPAAAAVVTAFRGAMKDAAGSLNANKVVVDGGPEGGKYSSRLRSSTKLAADEAARSAATTTATAAPAKAAAASKLSKSAPASVASTATLQAAAMPPLAVVKEEPKVDFAFTSDVTWFTALSMVGGSKPEALVSAAKVLNGMFAAAKDQAPLTDSHAEDVMRALRVLCSWTETAVSLPTATAASLTLTCVRLVELYNNTPNISTTLSSETIDQVLTAVSTTARLIDKSVKDMDDSRPATKKGGATKAPDAALGWRGDVLSTLHCLHRWFISDRTALATDGITTWVMEHHVSRIEDVCFALLTTVVKTSSTEGHNDVWWTYLATPALELLTCVAATVPDSVQPLVAGFFRRFTEPCEGLVKPTIRCPLSSDVVLALPAAFALRMAMCVAPLPAAVLEGRRRGDAQHFMSAVHTVGKHCVHAILSTFFTVSAVQAHSHRYGAIPVTQRFVDDLCNALPLPEFPAADSMLRATVTEVVRSVLRAELPSGTAAVASRLRQSAVDILGTVALATVRLSRRIDPDTALCELGWVTDANRASFAKLFGERKLESAKGKGSKKSAPAPPTEAPIPSADADTPLPERIQVVRYHVLSAAYDRDKRNSLLLLLARQLNVCSWSAKLSQGAAAHTATPHTLLPTDALLSHRPWRLGASCGDPLTNGTLKMLQVQNITVMTSDAKSMLHPDTAELLLGHMLSCLQLEGQDSSSGAGWDGARKAATAHMAALVRERPSLLIPAFTTVRTAITDDSARVREASAQLTHALLRQLEDHAERVGSAGDSPNLSQPLQPNEEEFAMTAMFEALAQLCSDSSSVVTSQAVHLLTSLLHSSKWLVRHPEVERFVVDRLVRLFATRGTGHAALSEKNFDALALMFIRRWLADTSAEDDATGLQIEADDDDDKPLVVTMVKGPVSNAPKAKNVSARNLLLTQEEALRATVEEIIFVTTAHAAPPFECDVESHPLCRVLGRRPGTIALHRIRSLSRMECSDADGAAVDTGKAPPAKAHRPEAKGKHANNTATVTKLTPIEVLCASQEVTTNAMNLIRYLAKIINGQVVHRHMTSTFSITRGEAAACLHIISGCHRQWVEPLAESLFHLVPSPTETPTNVTPEDKAIVTLHTCRLLRFVSHALPEAILFERMNQLLDNAVGPHQMRVLVAAIECMAFARHASDDAVGGPAPNRHLFAVLNLQYQRLRAITKKLLDAVPQQPDPKQALSMATMGCRFLFLLSELLRVVDWTTARADIVANLPGNIANMVPEGQHQHAGKVITQASYAATLAFVEACPKGNARAQSIAIRTFASLCIQAPTYFWPKVDEALKEALEAPKKGALPPDDANFVATHALSAIKDFLVDEERKTAMAAEAVSLLRSAPTKDTNSGMTTWVIQRFHPYICALASSSAPECRYLVVEVLEQAVLQGLLDPAMHVETLIALAADSSVHVRDRACEVLAYIADSKRDAISAKAVNGVVRSFECGASSLSTAADSNFPLAFTAATQRDPAISVHASVFRILCKSGKKAREQFVGGLVRQLYQPEMLQRWATRSASPQGDLRRTLEAFKYITVAIATLPLTQDLEIGVVLDKTREAVDLNSDTCSGWLLSQVPVAPSLMDMVRVVGLVMLLALKRFFCQEYGLSTQRVQRLRDRATTASISGVQSTVSSLSARPVASKWFKDYLEQLDKVIAFAVKAHHALASEDTPSEAAASARKPKGKATKAAASHPLDDLRTVFDAFMTDTLRELALDSDANAAVKRRGPGRAATKRRLNEASSSEEEEASSSSDSESDDDS